MTYLTCKISVQSSSVTQSCPTFCHPMDCSMPGLTVLHQLPEFSQIHFHWVSEAIQPSHPLFFPSPPTFNLASIRVFPFFFFPRLFIYLFIFILFFNFTILYWFCHISKWIRHRYTCVPHPEPSSFLPPHTIFSNESVLCIRWPKSIRVSASASVLLMTIQDWFPLGLTGWISLQSKGLSKVLQHHNSKASVFSHSAFFQKHKVLEEWSELVKHRTIIHWYSLINLLITCSAYKRINRHILVMYFQSTEEIVWRWFPSETNPY